MGTILQQKKTKKHGLGLQIVENIVNRYHGQITIDEKNNYFRVKVLLYNMENRK